MVNGRIACISCPYTYDKGRYHMYIVPQRIPLPEPVADIYRAVERLQALYPDRKFTHPTGIWSARSVR